MILCALFLQARLELYKGDFRRVLALLQRMRREITVKHEYHSLQMLEMCEGSIYAALDQIEKIPESIARPEEGGIRLRFAAQVPFQIIYGRVLLVSGQYLKLIGSADRFMATASVFPNLLGIIYAHIYLAAANHRIFREEEARRCLRKALEIALPDKLYMPFAENADYIAPLLEDLAREDRFQEGIDKIEALAATYQRAKQEIIAAYFREKEPQLTDREMEVARLAAEGTTNREIGRRLYISDNTVKSTLKIIYAKLSLNNRVLLKQYLKDHEDKNKKWSRADALAGADYAAKNGYPVLLSGKQSINAEITDYIAGLEIDNVGILGAEGAVAEKVKDEIG